MFKILVMLSFIFVSCENIEPQKAVQQQGLCGSKENCSNNMDWTIMTRGSDFPNKVILKINNRTFMNECILNSNFPFKRKVVGSKYIDLIATNFSRVDERTISLEIRNCENNKVYEMRRNLLIRPGRDELRIQL